MTARSTEKSRESSWTWRWDAAGSACYGPLQGSRQQLQYVKTNLLARRDDCSRYAQRFVWFTGNVASKIYQVFGVARSLEEAMQVPSLGPKITTASLQYHLIV
jgi:hypothetical protein